MKDLKIILFMATLKAELNYKWMGENGADMALIRARRESVSELLLVIYDAGLTDEYEAWKKDVKI